MILRPLLPFATAALMLPGIAHAGANLVTDGSFSAYTDSVGTSNFELNNTSGFGYGALTNWTVANAATDGSNGAYINLFNSNNQTGTAAQLAANAQSPSNSADAAVTQYGNTTQYLSPSYVGPSPDGGTFLAFSADSTTAGVLSQTISGLTVASIYNLVFYWAATEYQAAHAATTEQFQVSFGGTTQYTGVASIAANGFQGWTRQTMSFTATATSQTLSFLATGGPSGQPPLALLDGISLTVPEPASLPVVFAGIAGLAGFGALRHRGRRPIL